MTPTIIPFSAPGLKGKCTRNPAAGGKLAPPLRAHLEAVQHKVALLVTILVAHLGLRLEGVKRLKLRSTLQRKGNMRAGAGQAG